MTTKPPLDRLETLTKEIVYRAQAIPALEKKAADHIVALGQQIIEARGVAKKAGVKWSDWARDRIAPAIKALSKRHQRRLVKIAGAADPGQALEDQRAGNRAAKAKSRKNIEKKRTDGQSSFEGSPKAIVRQPAAPEDSPAQAPGLTTTDVEAESAARLWLASLPDGRLWKVLSDIAFERFGLTLGRSRPTKPRGPEPKAGTEVQFSE